MKNPGIFDRLPFVIVLLFVLVHRISCEDPVPSSKANESEPKNQYLIVTRTQVAPETLSSESWIFQSSFGDIKGLGHLFKLRDDIFSNQETREQAVKDLKSSSENIVEVKLWNSEITDTKDLPEKEGRAKRRQGLAKTDAVNDRIKEVRKRQEVRIENLQKELKAKEATEKAPSTEEPVTQNVASTPKEKKEQKVPPTKENAKKGRAAKTATEKVASTEEPATEKVGSTPEETKEQKAAANPGETKKQKAEERAKKRKETKSKMMTIQDKEAEEKAAKEEGSSEEDTKEKSKKSDRVHRFGKAGSRSARQLSPEEEKRAKKFQNEARAKAEASPDHPSNQHPFIEFRPGYEKKEFTVALNEQMNALRKKAVEERDSKAKAKGKGRVRKEEL